MRQRLQFIVALCALGAGCTRGTSSQESAAAKAPPHEVVATFLEAVRTGDDKQAAALLTPLARRKTTESEMVVAPPGSDTARFTVESVDERADRARVASLWTDLDSAGQERTDRIVWILRREASGWRICGMSAHVFSDQDPIELNFEDPIDMVRKQRLAEEEIARRHRDERRRIEDVLDAPSKLTR